MTGNNVIVCRSCFRGRMNKKEIIVANVRLYFEIFSSATSAAAAYKRGGGVGGMGSSNTHVFALLVFPGRVPESFRRVSAR